MLHIGLFIAENFYAMLLRKEKTMRKNPELQCQIFLEIWIKLDCVVFRSIHFFVCFSGFISFLYVYFSIQYFFFFSGLLIEIFLYIFFSLSINYFLCCQFTKRKKNTSSFFVSHVNYFVYNLHADKITNLFTSIHMIHSNNY